MICSKPFVVNKYVEIFDVYIGRGSKWGNPFSHQKDTTAKIQVKTREEAIEMYSLYILGTPDLLFDLPELENKRLGCTCSPKTCHGDVLCELFINFFKSNSEIDPSIFW